MKNSSYFKIFVAGFLLIGFGLVYGDGKGGKGRDKKQAGKNVVETYLDTLNRGKEMSLISDSISTGLSRKEDSAPSGKKIAPKGYRIQLMALSSMEAVREKKSIIEEDLQLKVYVDYDKPYYKVYVGDYIKRKHAEKALNEIKQSGYPDAWIVKSKVFVDK